MNRFEFLRVFMHKVIAIILIGVGAHTTGLNSSIYFSDDFEF